MEPQTIITAYLKLYNLLKEDSLQKALRVIGYVEYKAALESLDNYKIARDKRIQLTKALSHLESSTLLYLERAEERFSWWSLFLPIGEYHSTIDRIENLVKASQTSLIMSWCYAFLEEKALSEKYAEKAREHLARYTNKYVSARREYDESHEPNTPSRYLMESSAEREARIDGYYKSLEPAKVKLEESISAIRNGRTEPPA
jgi:hypothetical protein